MTVRAKFKCIANSSVDDVSRIRLEPVIEGSEENKQFYKYTPGGNIDLQVVGTEVASGFVKGQEYYVDFSPANQGELL